MIKWLSIFIHTSVSALKTRRNVALENLVILREPITKLRAVKAVTKRDKSKAHDDKRQRNNYRKCPRNFSYRRPFGQEIDLLGAVGVIASLIFVGFEVRQNTAAVRGATYQAIVDASLQHVQWWADNEKLLEFWIRINGGASSDEFTDAENLLIGASTVMTIRRMENIYVQVREGLVDEEAVLRFRPSKVFFETPSNTLAWIQDKMTTI